MQTETTADAAILLTCPEWEGTSSLADMIEANGPEVDLDEECAAIRKLAIGESVDVGMGGASGEMIVTRVAS